MGDATGGAPNGDDFQREVESYKALKESTLASFNSVIETGSKAIQAAFIINGGASLALLTFIGNMISKNVQGVGSLSFSMYLFTLGVLCVALATGARYVSQLSFHYKYDPDLKEQIKENISRGKFWQYTSMSLVGLSYFLFTMGIVATIEAFDRLKLVVTS